VIFIGPARPRRPLFAIFTVRLHARAGLLLNYPNRARVARLFPEGPHTAHAKKPSEKQETETLRMLESNSAASVSPNIKLELENGSTFTFNFQMDGRVTIIGFQDGQAVTGPLDLEQVEELRDAFNEYITKRKG
jgi:hypothetical protein